MGLRCCFQQKTCNIFETGQDGTKVTIDDQQKVASLLLERSIFDPLKIKQESRAVARKPSDAKAVLFGLKFADNIHYKFKSSQSSEAKLIILYFFTYYCNKHN